jgi:diguanylate cyclase (GGDEF)-like protein
LVLVLTQLINSLLILLLTAMPAQQNAGFSQPQGQRLLLAGLIGLLVRNLLLLGIIQFHNRPMFNQLGAAQPNMERSTVWTVWRQATTFTDKYLTFEFFGTLLIVLAPTLLYGYFILQINTAQSIHIALSALAACFATVTLENLTLNKLFKPVLEALLPPDFGTQLAGLSGMHLWQRLTLLIFGLLAISMLLVIPTAIEQVKNVSISPQLRPQLINIYLAILRSAAGAFVIGLILIVQLVAYFSSPFRKMIEFFSKIEDGDLKHRIPITLPDEFGRLNIYINQGVNQLEKLTTSLEGLVKERTLQLEQTNKELVIQLAERKRIQEKLTYTSLHDPLTDLPNRVLFLDRLTHAMERAKRNAGKGYAVFFLDLDRFKVVNDSMGHQVGDQLLIETAQRIKACLRKQDTVARLGGDEFVILLEDLKTSGEYKVIAERILQSLDKPADLGGSRVFMSVSIGIVLGNTRYKLADDLLRDADIAMYRAKKLGRNRLIVFKPSMLAGVMSHIDLEASLRKAYQNQEFVVHYQPIVNTQTRKIVGFEALLRWQHPSRGLILPAEFIPTLEETGLIVPVGYWVLEQACQQIKAWQLQYPSDPPISVSVNITTRQCTQPDLVQNLAEILQKCQLQPNSLKLELTESLVVEDSVSTASVLKELQDLGVQVQIDDFGTGYSALGYLHTLPIDALKIDRTFIGELMNSESGSEIVRTILSLAHSLKMTVIAEGVETKEQLAMLSDMKCEYVQGFLFARAVPPQEATNLLESTLLESTKRQQP